MITLLFAVQGHTDYLGGFGVTMAAICKIIGRDLLWKDPKPAETTPVVN